MLEEVISCITIQNLLVHMLSVIYGRFRKIPFSRLIIERPERDGHDL